MNLDAPTSGTSRPRNADGTCDGRDVHLLDSAGGEAERLPTSWRPSVPLPLDLVGGESLVWWFDTDLPPALLAQLVPLLAPAEIARADRFRFARDRNRFIVGRARLRTLLGRLTSRPAAAVEFDYGPYGKPALRRARGREHIHFNLSGSDGLGVIAVRLDHEVGVDVERIRPMEGGLAIAEHFFAEEESRALRSLPGAVRAQAFFRFWTRKEAVVKSIGLGLASPLDGFVLAPDPPRGAESLIVAEGNRRVVRQVLALHPPRAGFVAALAMGGTPCPVQSWLWPAGYRSVALPPAPPP